MNTDSIAARIFIPFFLATSLFAIILIGLVPYLQAKILNANMQNELFSIARTIAVSVELALEQESLEALAEFNSFLVSDANITVAAIFVDERDSFELLAAFPFEAESDVQNGVDPSAFLVAKVPFKTSRTSGHVEVGFSRAEYSNRLQEINFSLYAALAAIVVLQVIVYRILQLGVITPILASVKSANALGAGDLEADIQKPSRRDEIASLVEALIQLRETLKAQKVQNEALMHSLEQKVQERTAELSLALKVKDEFMAAVTHELRTPLHSIVASLDLIGVSQADSNDANNQYLSVAKTSSQTLLLLIDELLDSQKTLDGDLQLNAAAFNLFSVFEQSRKMGAVLFENSKVNFRAEFQGDPQRFVLGDEHRVKQVITNIIGNARKFTNEGQVLMIFKYHEIAHDMASLHVSIEDTGIGMTQETLDQLGEPFFQATSGFNREFGGAGLGISIVKQILSIMNSEIKIESTLGTGSAFSFELKLPKVGSGEVIDIKAVDEPALLTGSDQQPDHDHGHHLKVLYVEDTDLNRIVMGAMMARFSVELTMVESALQGIALARENRFDLIITDIQMPKHSGIELRQWLADDDDIHAPIVIAFTANADTSMIAHYRSIGFADVLTKPLTLDKLGQFLQGYVEVA